jgi:hypothetical protein
MGFLFAIDFPFVSLTHDEKFKKWKKKEST